MNSSQKWFDLHIFESSKQKNRWHFFFVGTNKGKTFLHRSSHFVQFRTKNKHEEYERESIEDYSLWYILCLLLFIYNNRMEE